MYVQTCTQKREETDLAETLRDRSGEQPITVGSCRVARRLGLGGSSTRRSWVLKLPRAEARENTWHIHQVGPVVADGWTRVAWEGVNILLRKILLCHSGCVTNWYQSMVTTLGLLGLMNELRRSSIRNTPKRSNPLS
jgi:hypothetical protein